ncbi:MAG: two-component regulator propeller domain-containing protein [Bacteroidota bacterium]|nr:two-component regulator propeller domain-containing protein [Bacteroidota bacterium]
MRYGYLIILSFLSFFISIYLYPQPANHYIFRHIDQSDGLLHNRVFSIVQDGRGLIWILTPNGLQRYDGSRFVNYPYDRNSPGGNTYTQDCHLFADKKNNWLWIVHENIEKLDLEKNNFTVYSAEQLLKDPSFGFETYMDSLNHPWLAGDFGIFHFDSSSRKMMPYYLSASWLAPGKSDYYFTDHQNNATWFAQWSYGLLLFDKKTKKIYSNGYNPVHHPLLQSMDKKGLFYIMAASDKNIWISSSRSDFYKYDPFTRKITAYSLSAIQQLQGKNKNPEGTLLVHCFFEDDHHIVWIGTQNAGLLKYDKETDTFIPITGGKESTQDVRYNYDINCIFQDREENIWLGTDKGITVFNPYRQYFQSVHHDDSNPLSLPKNEIQECIEARNGDILAGTWGGGITVYDNQWRFKKNIHFPLAPEEYNLVWSFIQNDDGSVWAGCQHGYIHIYDPEKQAIRTIHPPELSHATIHCMVKDKEGNIWLGLHNGKIAKWDKKANHFYAYNDSLPEIPQKFTPVQCLFIDNDQRCWAGTEYGLKEFDTRKRVYSGDYTTDKKGPSAISANIIQSIDGFDDSTLVIGTIYGGLNFFNTRAKTFSHLNTTNGLPSNTINNVKKDAGNRIWFTTDYGLYKYIPGNNKFVRYNFEPGIINSSFKSGNFYRLRNGRWLACTVTEIISFNPDSLQKQEPGNLPVDITGFKIFDKDIFIDSLIYAGKPVRLSYGQNFLTIEYGALSFSGLQETRYYYQLAGIDKDWVYAGSKRFASYTNLGPGEYTFHVKTENEGNDRKITSFTIIITPPFWKTTWFRLMALLLAVALIYYLFRRRIKAIRHEAGLKQKISETEMMALRAQMNPHFIFNCINSIDALIQSNDKYHATVYLNKFAKLLRNILDSSKQNTVPFSKDFETLKLYVELEELRHENKFETTFSIDAELLNSDYKVPPLIVQPFVENAILHGLRNKHGYEGNLSIEVKKVNDQIQYTITDNGIGRAAAEKIMQNKESHYGMQMSYDRVKLFNREETASVRVNDLYNNQNPAGTEVSINLNII